MGLTALLPREFDTTHERRFFDKLQEMLEADYAYRSEPAVLMGNLTLRGKDIDAIFLKSDALCVLEFKNYGGAIDFHENLDWCADGRIVGGGRNRNPYQQVRDYRYTLKNALTDYLTRPGLNLGHISGMVIFHQPARLNNELPQQISTWFHIADSTDVVRKLGYLTSKQLEFTDEELERIPEWLGAKPKQKQKQTKTSPPLESEPNKQSAVAAPEPEYSAFEQDLRGLLASGGYRVVHSETIPTGSQAARYAASEDLQRLHPSGQQLIAAQDIKLYSHQMEALIALEEEQDVCLATGTASGKTLVFHLAASQLLARDAEAVVLALYPSKALGKQQLVRWKKALKQAGVEAEVKLIDGDLNPALRTKPLTESRVLLTTPDVLHAWFMAEVNNKKEIRTFIRRLRLIILDEVHIYRGRVGSNMAYLLRRLAVQLTLESNQGVRLLAASATLSDPEQFLCQLTGRKSIRIIDREGAPRYPIHYLFVEPESGNYIDAALQLLRLLRDADSRFRFLSFFDSRQLVTNMAYLANLTKSEAEAADDPIDETAEDLIDGKTSITPQEEKALRKQYRIQPYRAGFMPEEQEKITEDFINGHIQGILSTSALEIGIDLPDINLGILFGMPPSVSSLRQRVGRIGRKQEGYVVIVHDGSLRSSLLFSKGAQVMQALPLEANHLYLNNSNLQVIQAQCLRRELGFADELPPDCESFFPEGFASYYRDLVKDQLPDEFESLLVSNDEKPHLKFALREGEAQYRAYSMDRGPLNDLPVARFSYSQLIREAYPGAVFKDSQHAWQVYSVIHREQLIKVKRVKRNKTTKRIALPKQLRPDLRGRIRILYKDSQLKVLVCPLRVSESVIGFWEGSLGKTPLRIDYPIKNTTARFDGKYFTQHFNTSGFIIWHECFDTPNVQLKLLARYLLKNLQTLYPFDPQDIETADSRLHVIEPHTNWNGIPNESAFLAFFDQGIYLQLSLGLADLGLLIKALENGLAFYQTHQHQPDTLRELFPPEAIEADGEPFESETIMAMEQLLASFRKARQNGGFRPENLDDAPNFFECWKPGTRIRLEDKRIGGINNIIERNGQVVYIVKVDNGSDKVATVSVPIDEPIEVLSENPQRCYYVEGAIEDEKPDCP